jgi:RNA polymerase sigma-70 factor (ECF subfamily)
MVGRRSRRDGCSFAKQNKHPMPKEPPKPSTPMPKLHDVDPDQMVREHIGWMLALAERLLRDRSIAEDAVQEAFISAFRGLPEFKGRSTLKTWLHRITVNASLTKLRQIKRRAEQSIDENLPEFDRHECRIEPSWTHLTTLQEVIESKQLSARVNEAISALPDSYRIVLQLRDIEGCNTAEVADLLEISEANVKVRLHRARAALKQLLDPVLRGELDP